MGRDRHGHYEFFPYVNLAHWRLWPHVDAGGAGGAGRLLPRRAWNGSAQRAEKNPYRLGTPLVWCSTNDVVALATQAALYEQMTGDTQLPRAGRRGPRLDLRPQPVGRVVRHRRARGRPPRQPAAPPVLQAEQPRAGRRPGRRPGVQGHQRQPEVRRRSATTSWPASSPTSACTTTCSPTSRRTSRSSTARCRCCCS